MEVLALDILDNNVNHILACLQQPFKIRNIAEFVRDIALVSGYLFLVSRNHPASSLLQAYNLVQQFLSVHLRLRELLFNQSKNVCLYLLKHFHLNRSQLLSPLAELRLDVGL